MKTVGEKLNTLRTRNNYTQEQIAKVLGVKREMVSYYENDERPISTTNLEVLLKFYGLSKKEFTSNNDVTAKVQVAYRKDSLDLEEFEEIAWLNKFVSNLSELKKMN